MFFADLGKIGYLLNIIMFSWITVMCLDLSWTFYRPQLHQGIQVKKLTTYCFCGFGIPILLTTIAGLCQVFKFQDKSLKHGLASANSES